MSTAGFSLLGFLLHSSHETTGSLSFAAAAGGEQIPRVFFQEMHGEDAVGGRCYLPLTPTTTPLLQPSRLICPLRRYSNSDHGGSVVGDTPVPSNGHRG